MPRPVPTQPTDGELEILSILWRRGSSSLREVHDTIQARRKTALTTTLKTLQIMTDKKLVVRDTSAHPSRYTAAREEARTQGGLLRALVDKAFAGSARNMVLRAVEDGELSADELRDIRKAIDEARKQKTGGKR
jgi:BlaI family transcriptional regulator, penicillinase repressor